MKEIRQADVLLRKLLPKQKLDSDICYVPSQFALSTEHTGVTYTINLLTKQCIEGELPAQCMAGEGYDDLIESYFLVPEGKDECKFYESIIALMRAYNTKRGHPGYTILPTLGCNARCAYCYEEGMKQVTMTPEIVERTIRYVIETHEEETVYLSWFGGEPLMCPHIIDRICEGMREAGLAYRSSMTSNASLVTPEMIEKMTGLWNLNKIQVSMDGDEKAYFQRKAYRDDRDYYHIVIENINLMAEAGINVLIRCNVDPQNLEGIPAFLDDLRTGIPEKKKVSLYFALLNDARMGDDDLKTWQKLYSIKPLIEEAGFSLGSNIGDKIRLSHCMADGNSVVICPDGSLYSCEHCPPAARFGDVFRGVTDEGAKAAFCRMDQTREMCRQCPFLPECTSFATCPIHDTHCREIMELKIPFYLETLLKRFSESGDASGNGDGVENADGNTEGFVETGSK